MKRCYQKRLRKSHVTPQKTAEVIVLLRLDEFYKAQGLMDQIGVDKSPDELAFILEDDVWDKETTLGTAEPTLGPSTSPGEEMETDTLRPLPREEVGEISKEEEIELLTGEPKRDPLVGQLIGPLSKLPMTTYILVGRGRMPGRPSFRTCPVKGSPRQLEVRKGIPCYDQSVHGPAGPEQVN